MDTETKNESTRFQESRDRGGAYILARQGADGAFPASAPSLADYYKVLTAFQVCGHNEAAHRLCEWIGRHGVTPGGDFGPRSEAAQSYAYAYFNAWVVCGAQRLGRFDLSQRGMVFLENFWDAESGGFYSSLHERAADTEQDLMVTSMCGLAALDTGRTEIARSVGEWLRTVRDAQPDFPSALYTVYSRGAGLQTSPNPDDVNRYVVYSGATQDQNFFNPGIAAAFLCRLFQSTGAEEWLLLAKEYMRFAEVASDYLFRIIRAGKVGWASSLLFTLTQEQKYREMAARIGRNLLALQFEEGFWSGAGGTRPNYDSTAERVVWMNEIDQAVCDD